MRSPRKCLHKHLDILANNKVVAEADTNARGVFNPLIGQAYLLFTARFCIHLTPNSSFLRT